MPLQGATQDATEVRGYLGETDIPTTFDTTKGTPDSEHGWVLPASGTLKVPVVLAKIHYFYGIYPVSNGTSGWFTCDLPLWANDLFDSSVPPNPQGLISRYYRQSYSENLNSMDSGLWSTHPDIDFMDGSCPFAIAIKSLDPEISFSHL